MFDHLKERFDLEDSLVHWLTQNEEFGELFKDYELLYEQSINYPRKSEQYNYYQDLLFELEEEIIDLLINHHEGHN